MRYSQAILNKNWLLQKIPWTDYWEVKKEFVWYVNYETKLSFIIIPEWFKTDFWSVPKFLQNIFSPTKYVWYILHDYLYSKDSKILISNTWDSFDEEISKLRVTFDTNSKEQLFATPNRCFADKTLRESIKVEWSWFLERNLVYLAVRLFWFLYFKNN